MHAQSLSDLIDVEPFDLPKNLKSFQCKAPNYLKAFFIMYDKISTQKNMCMHKVMYMKD